MQAEERRFFYINRPILVLKVREQPAMVQIQTKIRLFICEHLRERDFVFVTLRLLRKVEVE